MKTVRRVLIVDDDPDDQMMFSEVIQEIHADMICDVAGNGLEALDFISVPPPYDMIFLDINMPLMNGFECLIAIKKDKLYKNIPVIIMSTSSSGNDQEKSKFLGALDFITKPNDYHAFMPMLKQLLSAIA